MRVKILGDNLASRTLRGYIHALQYAVVDNLPDFTIHLSEGGSEVVIDGIDCDLERKAIKHFEDLGIGRFILERAGGIRSDREIKITYPAGKDQIIARGLARAILEAFKIKGAASKVAQVVKATAKVFSLLVLIVFFLPTFSYAQQFIFGRAWDSVNLAAVDPGDGPNRAIRINCITGCGGAGGTQNVNLIQLNTVALGSPSNYGTSPGAVAVIGVNSFITNTVAFNHTQLNSVALGSPSAYGTSPGAVNVPGVNAFITNTVTVSGTVTTTPPSNASTNITQFGGTNISTGTGAGGLGIPRVTISNDSSLAANQSVNVAQIGGTNTVTAAAGVQKVGIVGNANAALDAANNAALPANVVAIGVETIAIGTQPTAATAGNARRVLATTEGAVFTQEGSSNRFSCIVASTATVTTQCQAAPAAGLRAYVTSVSITNAVQTAQSVDVVFGTGAACVTGTTALTHKIFFIGATETGSLNFQMGPFPTPLVPTAANAICLRPTAATAFGGTITGYIAP